MSDMEENNENLLEYYKEAYEREKKRNAELTDELADAVAKYTEVSDHLNRIKSNPFWKLSTPLRKVMHFFIRNYQRLAAHGNPRGIAHKLKSKWIEKRAMKQHGKKSFPDAKRRRLEEETKFDRDITISILVPLYNTPKKFLTEMIDSVLAQTYRKWELCLADGSDDAHAYVGKICQEYAAMDSRIRYEKLASNEGISGNTNECYKMATGSYIGLFDHDDILHPSVLYEYMKAICEQDADYIYCDEATFKNGNIDNMITLHFKPDYAIDNLRANNYICHFSVFSRELLEGTELFRSRFDGSQDHDMILRLTTEAKHVVHIPRLLYYWRSHKGSVASDISAKTYAIEAARGAIADHLTRFGFRDFKIESTRAFETIFRIRYQLTAHPWVTILIPNKDHLSDLKRCVESILEKTTYENYDIVIVENNSTTDEIFTYYEEISKHPRIQVVYFEEGEFNYSRINNFGARYAKGDYLLLLNNDTQVITVNWIEEMLMYGLREDVGVVGAKLYYENKTIQHAGIVIGLGAHRTAGHTHHKVVMENVGYMGKLCYAQDVSAVTGACMLVKKSLYDELGGLSEEFAVALNDVDFCLRVREKGLLVVFTPFAELYHFESVSRGSDLKLSKREKAKLAKEAAKRGEEAVIANDDNSSRYNKEAALFRNRWKKILEEGDPYYNVNFSLDRSDYSLKLHKDKPADSPL
ncbi:MAG: glycosyltransferase family 2 protein [Lachnospiraceae bacterium]|nr:glycosyltransferase family 2 protein [Lachnospiraceae bacterium]